MATNKTFAEILTELREKTGKKRQEVADDLKISRASLEYYEKGKRKPDIEVLVRLADYYGVSTDYLLGLSNVPTTDKDLQFICDFTGLNQQSVEMLSKCNKECRELPKEPINLYLLVNDFINAFIENGLLYSLSLYANRLFLKLYEQKANYAEAIKCYREHGTLDRKKIDECINEAEDNKDVCLFKMQKMIISFFDDITFDMQSEINGLKKELEEISVSLEGDQNVNNP